MDKEDGNDNWGINGIEGFAIAEAELPLFPPFYH
jgi:hypothetical protein